MTKLLSLLCVVLVLAFGVVPVLSEADCEPVCDWGLKQEWDDDDTESFYDGACTIVLVQIKSATQTLLFDTNKCVDGYCVSGIGTTSGRVWEQSPRHDISNVEWCIDCPPTAVALVEVSAESDRAYMIVAVIVVIAALVVRAIWADERKRYAKELYEARMELRHLQEDKEHRDAQRAFDRQGE